MMSRILVSIKFNDVFQNLGYSGQRKSKLDVGVARSKKTVD